MEWWNRITEYLTQLGIYSTTMDSYDYVEILIIAFLLYYLLLWIKGSRAWSLVKGILVIGVFLILAYLFQMNTILWIVKNVISFAVIALIVVLQPELRRALEELGKRNILGSLIPFDFFKEIGESVEERTINEIVEACSAMGKVKTGALIVIEGEDPLAEWERNSVTIDAEISSQLLINIFEKNTPLHDGALIIRGNRVASATCVLPLSDSVNLDKDLGTRHRAGVGISEISDSVTVIVSEETGKLSIAYEGRIERGYNAETLKCRLEELLISKDEDSSKRVYKSRRKSK